MDGEWGDDLEDWLVSHYGIIRREALGPRDLSSNVLRMVTMQLSSQYDEDAVISHPLGEFPELLANGDDKVEAGLIPATGLWPLMQNVQQMTIALGEYLMHVSYNEEDGFLFRPVPPDYILAEARPEAPDRPVLLRELRKRVHPHDSARSLWTWDEYDIRDKRNPTFRVLSGCRSKGATGVAAVAVGEDLTSAYLSESQSGEGYFWRKADGTPVIPYVMYHRSKTGKLWYPYCGRELTDGTLTVAALWTDFVHAVRDASWLQRYLIGCEPAGAASSAATPGGSPWNSVPADRSSIMVFVPNGEPGQPATAGAFPAPSDPDVIGRAIMKFEERLAQYVGVNPADLSRTSGDPRSGYALAVSEHGKQVAQRRYLPHFRKGDQELVALAAMLINRVTGSTYPESGYRLRYAFQSAVDAGKPVPEKADATPADDTNASAS
ncbi:MAG: hypothetical protein Q8P18_18320 [Pseudomonadota bacterium]|nr:hypothetical protein [Pseudomonadota bacterium]